MIFNAEPLAAVVMSGETMTRCAFCFAVPATCRSCSRCKSIVYCGEACQRGDWPDHSGECGRLAEVKPRVFPTTLRLAFRLLDACRRSAATAKAVTERSFGAPFYTFLYLLTVLMQRRLLWTARRSKCTAVSL